MRLTGYCIECRNIRPVRVSGSFIPGRVPTGVCMRCEEKEREREKERRK